jgi:heptosyltransferase-2
MDRSPILIVGPSWVGDMVMAQSLARLLSDRRPGAPIDVLAPGWSLPVIARMPEVRAGIVAPGGHGEMAIAARRRLGIALRENGYGQAIVLPRSLKAALVPWFARIPRRTGIRGEMRFGLINDMRPFDARTLDQTVKRFLALGLEPGERLGPVPRPALSVSPERQQASLDRLSLTTDRPVVAMMPGAEYGPAKCWPIEYFRELAGMLATAGFAVWVFGSARDRPAGAAIAAGGHARDLCGATELAEVVDLLAACRCAVTNDSGLMHVAAAVGTRVIALYGSTSPDFTPPLADDARIHYLGLDCSPCFERQCPLHHLRCLREIRPAAVFADIVDIARE